MTAPPSAMSDIARVRRALASGTLLHPCEGSAGTVDLARALAVLAGDDEVARDARSDAIAETIGHYDHYVFVLVDGLGMNLIERLPKGSFFRDALAMELRAVFPSSTAPALTSIATTAWPGEHAVTGWWTYLPDHDLTATILPFVERFTEQPLDERNVNVDYAFPLPSRQPRFRHEVMTFTPRNIAGSTYSRYSSGEARFVGYLHLANAVDAIVERIASAEGPTYSSLYVPYVDMMEHRFGPDSTETTSATNEVHRRIEELAEKLDGRARLVLSADHGQMHIPVALRHIIARDDELAQMLRVPPSGDGRAPLFHVKHDALDAFPPAFRARFGDEFALITIAKAVEMRLFGPNGVSEETRRRLGDFVAMALDSGVILYEPSSELRGICGHHGGLAPEEMRIPLIVS